MKYEDRAGSHDGVSYAVYGPRDQRTVFHLDICHTHMVSLQC